jgi:DnaK suppressor protein
MSSLTAEQRQALIHLLEQREAQLGAEIRAARRAADERDVASREAADRGDEAAVQIQSGIDHAELERDVRELLDIELARSRLAEGSYGDCLDCDDPIGYLRLQAQPAAQRCAACQAAFERTHFQGR